MHFATPIGLGAPSAGTFAGNTFPQKLHSAIPLATDSVFDIATVFHRFGIVVRPMMLWIDPRNRSGGRQDAVVNHERQISPGPGIAGFLDWMVFRSGTDGQSS